MRAKLGMFGALAVIGLGLFTSNAKADEWHRRAPSGWNSGATYVVPVYHYDNDGRRFEGRRDDDGDREWRRSYDRDWDRYGRRDGDRYGRRDGDHNWRR